YLHQSNTMQIPFTVQEIVAMGRYHKQGNQQSEAEIITECLKISYLDHLRDRSISQLSGGEQQRVHLARVLAQLWDAPTGILLLDEPISNMDIQYQHQTLAIAKAFSRIGFLVIAVLHDLNLVAQYSDNVLMMKSGKLWWYGSPNEIFNQQNIYSIFGIDTTISVNPANLITQVQASPLSYVVSEFNSFYRAACANTY
ncbi:MAG: ATP-binding cassette domain-containing protein, partial [Sphingobacterium sp.]